MGVWFPSPQLEPGEAVEFQGAANRFKQRHVVGGQITVTSRRLLFVPNRLEMLFGQRNVELSKSSITEVNLLEPGWQAVKRRGLGAALRRQVHVEHASGAITVAVGDIDAFRASLTNNRSDTHGEK